jgi:ankyrin repeat protein
MTDRERNTEKLWLAARTGDDATIRQLAAAGVDLDTRDPEDRTAFNIATQHGLHRTAQTILDARRMQYFMSLAASNNQSGISETAQVNAA